MNYIAPATVAEAVAALNQFGPQARVLAGGTDIIVQVRERRRDVSAYVDVKHIPELTSVTVAPDESLRLGAAVSCANIYGNADVASRYPALIDSASLIGGIQIQSRASLGGNLCNGSPAADAIPTLIALGATCDIAGPNGTRTIPVEEMCTGPGQTQLQPGEILVSLNIPAPAPHSGAAFERFIPRNEMDIAVANAAASVVLSGDGSQILRGRVALGAVAPTPLFVAEASQLLENAAANEETIQKVAAAARAAAKPITDMRGSTEQRTHLAGVLTARVLNKAISRARGE